MKRPDSILIAAFAVALLLGVSFALPEGLYRKSGAGQLDSPPCNVPRNREFAIDYYGLTYAGNTNNLIDRRVLCLGAWEKHILELLGQTASALAAAPDGGADELVFVDIGSNTGLHSLYMSQRVGRVHAFDPYPPVVALMRRNLTLSKVENVTLHPIGLGDQAAMLPFLEPLESNQGTGSYAPEAGLPGEDTGLELEIVIGDEYFPEHGIDRVDIIKMDVEGFEKAVLRGLRRTLREQRPVLVFELSVGGDGDGLFRSREELLEALPPDYQLFEFAAWDTTSGYYRLTDFQVDFDTFLGGQWDVVAAPSEHAGSIPMTAQTPAN